MTDTHSDSVSESLPTMLASGARSRTDGALALAAIVGLALAALAVIIRFPVWMAVAGAGAALSGFGLWGVCDRELAERGGSPGAGAAARVLWLVRILVAAAGALGALLSTFALLHLALGTWIS